MEFCLYWTVSTLPIYFLLNFIRLHNDQSPASRVASIPDCGIKLVEGSWFSGVDSLASTSRRSTRPFFADAFSGQGAAEGEGKEIHFHKRPFLYKNP